MDLFTTLVAPIAEYVVDAEMAKLNNGQFALKNIGFCAKLGLWKELR